MPNNTYPDTDISSFSYGNLTDIIYSSTMFESLQSVDGFLTLRTPDSVYDGKICTDSFTFPQEMATEQTSVHTSGCFVLRVLVSGKGSHLWNGEIKDIRRGAVFLLTPNTAHRLNRDKLEFVSVYFSESSIYNSFIDIINSSAPLDAEYNSAELEMLLSDIETIRRESDSKNAFSDEMSRSVLSKILIGFFRKCQARPSESPLPEHPVVRAISSFVMHHFRSDITLRELAEVVGITPNYLGEVFIQATGTSCSSYVRDLRISFAKQLLAGTSFSVSDISLLCGFRSTSYFVRIFRETCGITPLQYRRTI